MRKCNYIRRLLAGATALTLLAMPGIAAAQDRPTDPSTVDILEVLVEKGVLTRADADGVLAEARKRAETREAVVRVPYVPEAVRNRIREEVRQDVIQTAKAEGWAQPGALPAWLDRVDIYGDVRVRGEALRYQKSNTPLVIDTNAVNANGGFTELDVLPYRDTITDRYRARVRARLGVDVQVNSHVDAGIRIVTGNQLDPASTNESMTRNFGRYMVGFDRAFVRLLPFGRTGSLAGTKLEFGKFDNPFQSTELLYDDDIQFEGVAATIDFAFSDTDHLFAVGGAFPLEEYDFTGRDKYLLAGQIGGRAEPFDGFRVALAGGYYHYANVQGRFDTPGLRDNDYTAPQRVQFGNSLFNLRRDPGPVNTVLLGLASNFRVAAVTAQASFDLTPTLTATLDFEGARNLAFDQADLAARMVPGSSGDTAFLARATVGHRDINAAHAWSLSAGYRRLEADATLDLFTDSDFGLGGTDQKGFVIRGIYAPFENVAFTGTWLSSRTIDLVDQFGNPALPIDIDTIQLDLSVKF